MISTWGLSPAQFSPMWLQFLANFLGLDRLVTIIYMCCAAVSVVSHPCWPSGYVIGIPSIGAVPLYPEDQHGTMNQTGTEKKHPQDHCNLLTSIPKPTITVLILGHLWFSFLIGRSFDPCTNSTLYVLSTCKNDQITHCKFIFRSKLKIRI